MSNINEQWAWQPEIISMPSNKFLYISFPSRALFQWKMIIAQILGWIIPIFPFTFLMNVQCVEHTDADDMCHLCNVHKTIALTQSVERIVCWQGAILHESFSLVENFYFIQPKWEEKTFISESNSQNEMTSLRWRLCYFILWARKRWYE